MILLPGGGSLFEMTSSPLELWSNVTFLGLALGNHSETKKKGETKCKIQRRRLPRVSDSLVYSSMVSVNV
jgi:hypothetical protein